MVGPLFWIWFRLEHVEYINMLSFSLGTSLKFLNKYLVEGAVSSFMCSICSVSHTERERERERERDCFQLHVLVQRSKRKLR